MAGYANRVIKLDFPDLSEDPVADPVWVIIRNPKLLPQAEILSVYDGDTGFSAEGKMTDRAQATTTTQKMIAKLIVAARVYDATELGQFDPLTGEPVGGGQALLPAPPWTPENAARLPSEISTKISQTFAEALNPPSGPGAPTPKTSSGQPSPSTTEPGPAEQPQPS